jgi:hypothetical protein
MAGRTSYYGGIVLDGLVFHIDAAKQESYAKRGLRYMQTGNNNLFIDFADTSISPSTKNATGTIINGATFSNFAPYHLTPYYSTYWHNPSEYSWTQSAGVGTFYGNIEFDGVDDYVSFDATPDINTTDITVSAWFYVNKFKPSISPSGGTVSMIASRYSNTTTTNGWEIGYNNNGVVWFGGMETSGTYISVTASLLVKQTNNITGTANGGWYNAVGTKSGNQWGISVAETNCYRHVDNIAEVLKTSLKHLSLRTIQLGTGTIPFGTNSLVLGKASDSNRYYMNGRLMNVSIYNRALSLAEINQNFDSFSKRIIDIEGITPLVLTCNSSIVPPAVINGITITESYSGSVNTYPSAYSSCGGSVTTPTNSKWLGSGGSFSYTMIFSSPVNNITIVITAAGGSINENFIITTNTGIPSITSTLNCYTTIIGNEILAGAGAPGGIDSAGGYFFISNLSPFTTLTITGAGGQNGSLLSICSDSLNLT